MALKVGIIGCGAIAREIARGILGGKVAGASLSGAFDSDKAALSRFTSEFKVKAAAGASDLASGSDIVVEAASQAAVAEHWQAILPECDMMVMSVGALLDKKLLTSMQSLARKSKTRILAPSGAVCGIDAAKAASIGKLAKATLTTRKSPKALGMESIGGEGEKVLFDGPATDAVKQFPKNINVAAVIQLAIGWGTPLRVRIIADDRALRNTHELSLEGDFGELAARISNNPSQDNPKTSRIAALSALAVLAGNSGVLMIGN